MTSEWKTSPLRDLVGFISKGIAPSYADEESETTVRVLNQKCNRNFRITYSESRLHDLARKKVPAERFVRIDDILINSTGAGTAGRIAQICNLPCDTIVDGHMIIIRANDKVSQKYLGYAMKAHQWEVLQLDEGSTGQTELNRERLLDEIMISYPTSFALQETIVKTLEGIDRKLLINEKVNDNLLGQMQALYRSWFVDFLPFGGSKPRTWTETDIYSLANIIYGAPFKSKQFNTDGVGTPIIRIRDLKDQQFATYTTEIHPKGYLLQPGDIVVGMDGEFRPYIWGNDGAWLNQRVCVFENKRPNGKAFLYFTIKPLLYGIEQTQVATTVIHIGKKDFDAFEITLPDASTLDDFDALTTPMMRVIVSNCFENKRLAALRDILLPKLMSGEIDVSDIQL